MLLLTHIIIAILSVAQATYTLAVPSATKMRLTRGLAVATLVSGSVLVWQLHVSIVGPCMSGLVYIGIVSALLLGAKYRFAHQTVRPTDWSRYLDK